MDIEKLSTQELNELKGRIDRRLRDAEKKKGRSLVERLSEGETTELVVTVVKRTGIRCRTLGDREPVTLRPTSGVRSQAEAHILTVRPRKAWTCGRTTYLSGQILDMRLDVPALKLAPLKLRDETEWDPKEEYWGDDDRQIEDFFKPIIAAGVRPSFEMEQILPGSDPEDMDSDPIGQAVDFYEAGDLDASLRVLHGCLDEDLRVLDAYAHLGNWRFGEGDSRFRSEEAQRNYQAGVAIGDLSLGPGFKGLLGWGRIDNRPFLRCLHGLGLCHWALGDLKGAAKVFERMLWLNPRDNQGARFCLTEILEGTRWEDSEL